MLYKMGLYCFTSNMGSIKYLTINVEFESEKYFELLSETQFEKLIQTFQNIVDEKYGKNYQIDKNPEIHSSLTKDEEIDIYIKDGEQD